MCQCGCLSPDECCIASGRAKTREPDKGSYLRRSGDNEWATSGHSMITRRIRRSKERYFRSRVAKYTRRPEHGVQTAESSRLNIRRFQRTIPAREISGCAAAMRQKTTTSSSRRLHPRENAATLVRMRSRFVLLGLASLSLINMFRAAKFVSRDGNCALFCKIFRRADDTLLAMTVRSVSTGVRTSSR